MPPGVSGPHGIVAAYSGGGGGRQGRGAVGSFTRRGRDALISIPDLPKTDPRHARLCMSDEEFRAYLHEALLFQLGYGGAVCCARDASRPNSCKAVTQQAKRIEE